MEKKGADSSVTKPSGYLTHDGAVAAMSLSTPGHSSVQASHTHTHSVYLVVEAKWCEMSNLVAGHEAQVWS